jgi:hypothetical protein
VSQWLREFLSELITASLVPLIAGPEIMLCELSDDSSREPRLNKEDASFNQCGDHEGGRANGLRIFALYV